MLCLLDWIFHNSKQKRVKSFKSPDELSQCDALNITSTTESSSNGATTTTNRNDDNNTDDEYSMNMNEYEYDDANDNSNTNDDNGENDENKEQETEDSNFRVQDRRVVRKRRLRKLRKEVKLNWILSS